MNRQLVSLIVVFLVSMLSAYFVNAQLFEVIISSWPFQLKNAYLFHSSFSLMLCLLLFFLSKTKKMNNQIGFIYLFSFGLKLLVFSLIFKAQVISLDSLPLKQSLSLLFPLFLALVFEVIFLGKILKNKSPIKNG